MELDQKERKKSIFEFRPVTSIFKTTICLGIVGILSFVYGIIVLSLSLNTYEIIIRYDNKDDCNKSFTGLSKPSSNLNFIESDLESNQCEIQLTVYKLMKGPIYVYYQLTNFYQNHRIFIKSFSNNQLNGEVINTTDLIDDCSPVVTMSDLGLTTSYGGQLLPKDAPANPCGLYPKYFFNDTFKLKSDSLFINETAIAYQSDPYYRYKTPVNSEKIQWINVTDEHFMVWMRPASGPDFRKLWGRIDSDLNEGNYTIVITNNYRADLIDSTKSLILSTKSFLGGKNSFMGTAYIIIGVFCILMISLVHLSAYNKQPDKSKIN